MAAISAFPARGYSTTLSTGTGLQHYTLNRYRGTALCVQQLQGYSIILSSGIQGYSTTLSTGKGVQHYTLNRHKGIILHSQQVKGYSTALSTDHYNFNRYRGTALAFKGIAS